MYRVIKVITSSSMKAELPFLIRVVKAGNFMELMSHHKGSSFRAAMINAEKIGIRLEDGPHGLQKLGAPPLEKKYSYFKMKELPMTLKDYLVEIKPEELELRLKIAKALEMRTQGVIVHLNEFGLAHLDIKPENILVTQRLIETREPRPEDFFISDVEGIDSYANRRLEGKPVFGTLGYIAPERFTVRSSVEESAKTIAQEGVQDSLYGLGVVIFETLTGKIPNSYYFPKLDSLTEKNRALQVARKNTTICRELQGTRMLELGHVRDELKIEGDQGNDIFLRTIRYLSIERPENRLIDFP